MLQVRVWTRRSCGSRRFRAVARDLLLCAGMNRCRIVLSSLALLPVFFAAGSASADLEELSPATAHEQVVATSGVVFVDLYAHW